MPRRTLRWSPVAAAVVLLAGCGDDATQDFYVEPEIPPDPIALTNEAAEDVADREVLPPVTTLAPIAGSGAEGTARISTAGGSTTLEIEIRGLPEAGEFAAHVHRGVCAEGGPVAALLTSVAGGADGSGTSSTTVPSADLPPNEPLFIQVHGLSGAPIACGDIVEP